MEEDRFDVMDEEAEANTRNRYYLPSDRVLPLPKSNSCREPANTMNVLGPGAAVLAVYPGTTTFYRGTVVQSPTRRPHGDYSEYIIEFEARKGGKGRPLPKGAGALGRGAPSPVQRPWDEARWLLAQDDDEGGLAGRPVEFKHVTAF